MKKTKKTIYLRYEFSDEAGQPEGGDIFQFTSLKELLEMAGEIGKVANSDQVAVNLTIGEDAPFFGFLASAGMSRQDVEKEMVDLEASATPAEKKKTKKTASSKKAVSKKKPLAPAKTTKKAKTKKKKK